jgi:cbb3-type cytochrome oxidase subunit 1
VDQSMVCGGEPDPFFAGTALGLFLTVHPSLLVQLRLAHVHVKLAGFMTMMAFGVGYHISPRFSGRPLDSRCLVSATF